MPKPDELLGSTEAARLLGCSPRTVHRLVAAGTLVPAMTAPGGYAGSFLFHASDVRRVKASRETATADGAA